MLAACHRELEERVATVASGAYPPLLATGNLRALSAPHDSRFFSAPHDFRAIAQFVIVAAIVGHAFILLIALSLHEGVIMFAIGYRTAPSKRFVTFARLAPVALSGLSSPRYGAMQTTQMGHADVTDGPCRHYRWAMQTLQMGHADVTDGP